MLPQEEMIMDSTKKKEEPFSEDIQKELEAKFDELFGPMDGE